MIITSADFWEDAPRARYQVAEAIAKKHKVYFVSANKPGLPNLKKCWIHKNFVVMVPYFPTDYRIRYRIPFINKIYQAWLFKLLEKESNDENEVVVINFDNTATEIFKYFKNVIYFCNDYNIRYFYFAAIKRYLEKSERIVAKNAKLCVATSQFLVDRLEKFNGNVLESRLGAPNVEGELFFRKNKKLKIGLVGFHLHEKRISIEIIRNLVRNPIVELYVYGRVSKKLKAVFSEYSNIKMRGVLKRSSLLNELKQISVGIAPYRLEDVNPGGTSNKLWVYLAVGKPVVMSDLPNIKKWHINDKFIYSAKTETEFVEKVVDAYRDDNEELMYSRARFALDNSWDSRIHILMNGINKSIVESRAETKCLDD